MDDLKDMEQAMEAHRREMTKENKIFTAVYLACLIPALLKILLGLCMIVVTLVTLGTTDVGVTPLMMLEWFTLIGAVFLYGMSNAKSKRCTGWSIGTAVLLSLITAVKGMFPLMYLLTALLQGICYLRYDRIDHLKCQLGYPDFNPSVYAHKVSDQNRRMTDTQVKAQLADNRENRQKAYMEEINTEDTEDLEDTEQKT